MFIAFHDLFVNEKKSISNYSGVKGAITNITDRIVTSRQATSPEERQKNVDTIKALVSPHFVNIDPTKLIYANHSSLDIDSYIRCSGMELAHFELKQGVVSLGDKREINRDLINRIVNTICALANNGPNRTGRIVLGVADKDDDVKRIIELDSITPRQVGAWTVVGVNREAKALGISLEDYHNLIRSSIEKSELSNPLKNSVLSSIDFNAYYGLGIIIITIPEQQEPSYVGDDMYWRDGDNTKIATGAKQIAEIGRRF
ncbi:helix-turn-helix domain-containing protein [Aeromonas caviae]|uniref:AlbA family DNA-binding domain-containing protein n=1 Tax=Aeromonas caviae TaxID=648 RepID=UPI000AB353CD|nr:ATP-binding protein [Aeromonas caviae]